MATLPLIPCRPSSSSRARSTTPATSDDPCPPTEVRITEYNARAAADATKGTPNFTRLTAGAPPPNSGIIVQPYAVRRHQAKLLMFLKPTVEKADSAPDLVAGSKGNGVALLKLVKAEGATATPADRAACTAKYNSVIREGVSGPLTLTSWKEFLKRERKAKMHLPPGERPSAEAEMANFTSIGFADPDFRQTFNLEVRLQKPTTPLDLAKLITSILTANKRNEEIDALANAAPPPVPGALSAEEIAKQKNALAAAGAVPDPRKSGGGGGGGGGKPKGKGKDKDKKKVKPPRDSEGNVTKWIEGMEGCNTCGGKHLHRDCPQNQDSTGTGGAPATGAAAVADGPTLAIKDVQGLTGAELHKQLTDFFDSADPCVECDGSSLVAEQGAGKGIVSYFKNLFFYCWPLLLLLSFVRSAAPAKRAFPSALAAAKSCKSVADGAFRLACRGSEAAAVLLLLCCGASMACNATTAACSSAANAVSRATAAHHYASVTADFLPNATYRGGSEPFPLHCVDLPDDRTFPHYGAVVVFAPRSTPLVHVPPIDAQFIDTAVPSVLSDFLVWLAHAFESTRAAAVYAASVLGVDHGGAWIAAATTIASILHVARIFAIVSAAAAFLLFGLALSPVVLVAAAALRLGSAIRGCGWRVRLCLLLLWLHLAPSPSPSSPPSFRLLDTPQRGDWLPKATSASEYVHPAADPRASEASVPQCALLEELEKGQKRLVEEFDAGSKLHRARRAILAPVDSGCTGSLTWNINWLINCRPCSERFTAADGTIATCTCIGDMPVLCRLDDGTIATLVIRNVRCIPSFKYTLLSVTQLWEEQRIDSQFNDTKALLLPRTGFGPFGKRSIRYEKDRRMPTVRLISAVGTGLPGTGTAAAASSLDSVAASSIALAAGVSSAPLGFHRVGSASHVGHLPAAKAAELMHRRSHAGIGKIRQSHFATSDAPKNLSSASAVAPCDACATARIKKASHSGTLDAPAPQPGVLHVDLKEMVRARGGTGTSSSPSTSTRATSSTTSSSSSPRPQRRSSASWPHSTPPSARPSTRTATLSLGRASARSTRTAKASSCPTASRSSGPERRCTTRLSRRTIMTSTPSPSASSASSRRTPPPSARLRDAPARLWPASSRTPSTGTTP